MKRYSLSACRKLLTREFYLFSGSLLRFLSPSVLKLMCATTILHLCIGLTCIVAKIRKEKATFFFSIRAR